MLTFISLTHAPSTPLSVLVARATASLIASSNPSLLLFHPIFIPTGRMSNMRVRALPLEGIVPPIHKAVAPLAVLNVLLGRAAPEGGLNSKRCSFFAHCRSTIALTQAMCQRVDVEVGGVHDGRLWEVLWRRVLLSDAAIENDDFFIAPDLSPIAQYWNGG